MARLLRRHCFEIIDAKAITTILKRYRLAYALAGEKIEFATLRHFDHDRVLTGSGIFSILASVIELYFGEA